MRIVKDEYGRWVEVDKNEKEFEIKIGKKKYRFKYFGKDKIFDWWYWFEIVNGDAGFKKKWKRTGFANDDIRMRKGKLYIVGVEENGKIYL